MTAASATLVPRKNQVVPEKVVAVLDVQVVADSSIASSAQAAQPSEPRPRLRAKPLQGAGADDHLCDNIGKTSEYRGETSDRTFHLFVNETDADIEVSWFYDHGEFAHGDIAPGSNMYAGTYTYHSWRLKEAKTGVVLGEYSGDSAIIVVRPGVFDVLVNPSKQSTLAGVPVKTSQGIYSRRAIVEDIGIWAFEFVEDAAVVRAGQIMTHMLAHCPADLRQGLVAAGATLGIVGRKQVVSDLPPHAFMKYNQGRNVDQTARGLGATPHIPVTSVGEENLTMIHDEVFSCQSILVHEFGHLVMNLAFDQARLQRVMALYCDSRSSGRYPADIYSMCNEQEYWANGVEAWFEATVRTDVNSGINTRQKIREQDPGLAALLLEVFGDGAWRYQHDSPLPLIMPHLRKKRPADLSAEPDVEAPGEARPDFVPTITPITRAGKGLPALQVGPNSAPTAPRPGQWYTGLSNCLPNLFASCGKRPRDERTMQ